MNLQIIRKNDIPYGIRDDSGFLLFFSIPTRYQDQEGRFRTEINELEELSESILNHLKRITMFSKMKKDLDNETN